MTTSRGGAAVITIVVGFVALVFALYGTASTTTRGPVAGVPRARERPGEVPRAEVEAPAMAPAAGGPRLAGVVDVLQRVLEGPRRPTPEQERIARRIVELFNDFDLEAAAAVYAEPSIGMEEWVLWLHARLGKCGEGRPLTVTDTLQARYVYECERGELEAGFTIDPDTGLVPKLVMGARGVAAAEPVLEAAGVVLGLMESWDPALFRRSFIDAFEEERIRRFLLDVRSAAGKCRLGEPELVSVRGIITGLVCEHGDLRMKVELGQDDRIRILWIREPKPQR